MIYPKTCDLWWYWSESEECWVECSEEDYYRLHYGKTFTRITEGA